MKNHPWRPFYESEKCQLIVALFALALTAIFDVCYAADTLNPHADLEIVYVTPGELRAIIVAHGDPSFPRAPANWKPEFYESERVIWIAKRGEVETSRTLLRVLRKRGLLTNDGATLAPTEKGVDHGR